MDIRRLYVTQQIDIAADAHRCFDALTGDISPWWGSPYLLLEEPQTRIHAEPRLGGLVSERADGHEAVWGTVSELDADRVIAWTGRIGLGDAVTGTARFALTERAGVTQVHLEHESIGAFGAGSQGSYEHGWHDLLHRLKAFVEDGVSYGISGKNAPPPALA